MIKLVLVAFWACCVALGSAYATSLWKSGAAASNHDQAKVAALEFRKALPLNVPVVKNGEIQGYIVAQIGLVVETAAARQMTIPPEVYLIDEGFSILYSDSSIDLLYFNLYDLSKLKSILLARLKERTGSDAVKEVIVHDFNFVMKRDLR